MMAYFIDEAKLDYQDGKKDPDIDKPDTFSQRKWLAWEETVYTYFNAAKNNLGLPIAYAILNTPVPSSIFIES